jgi:hypothetical protein
VELRGPDQAPAVEVSKEDVKFLLSLASEMGEVAANCIR